MKFLVPLDGIVTILQNVRWEWKLFCWLHTVSDYVRNSVVKDIGATVSQHILHKKIMMTDACGSTYRSQRLNLEAGHNILLYGMKNIY